MNIIRRMTCKHECYRLTRQIFGDEINHRDGLRSEWRCKKCGAWAGSTRLTVLQRKRSLWASIKSFII